MDIAIHFIQIFGLHLIAVWPLMMMLAAVVFCLGLIVGRIEHWAWFDAIYWAFITATTVGYGDIRPVQRLSRIISVLIAFVGITFTGIFVALAINSTTLAFEKTEATDDAAQTSQVWGASQSLTAESPTLRFQNV